MRLDVGGIAKGYASQAAIDVLRSQGITRALVGGAGDIVVADPPPDVAGWTIAIAGLNPSEAEPRDLHPAQERRDLDLRRRRAVRDHRRPSLLPHHQPCHRNGRRGPRQRDRGRPRRRHRRRTGNLRLPARPGAGTEADRGTCRGPRLSMSVPPRMASGPSSRPGSRNFPGPNPRDLPAALPRRPRPRAPALTSSSRMFERAASARMRSKEVSPSPPP